MTSAPISEMSAMFANMNANKPVQQAKDDNGQAFGDILGSVSVVDELKTQSQVSRGNDFTSNKIETSDSNKAGSRSQDDRMKVREDANTTQANSKSEVKSDVASTEDTKADAPVEDATVKEMVAKDVPNTVSNKILQETAKLLDIDVEELEEVLETMGLTALDIMNPQNVNALVANVKADGDVMSIVANEDIANLVMDINNTVVMTIEEASKELGIEPNDFKALIEEAVKVNVSDVADKVSTNTPAVSKEVINEGEMVVGDKELVTNDEGEVVTLNVDNANDAKEASTNEGDSKGGELSKKEDSKDNSPVVHNTVAGNVTVDNQVNEVTSLETDTPVSRYADTQDVINQITEQMRVINKDNLTELQMKLNPENLGNVNLTLVSKEGNVTASFTAQNEAVKNALEAQIVVLKENLEAQGVKVEAIEVSVASHGFERNLDEQNQKNNAQEEEEQRLKKATRKLNISDLLADDNIEELDEEEIVTAKMMAADGNSMDYKV